MNEKQISMSIPFIRHFRSCLPEGKVMKHVVSRIIFNFVLRNDYKRRITKNNINYGCNEHHLVILKSKLTNSINLT